MKAMIGVGLALAAPGCTTCRCLGADGPLVDMNDALPDVRAVYEGGFAGEVAQGEGAACAAVGGAFELELAVDPPSCRDPDHPDRGCARAREATFGLSGTFVVGEAEPEPVSGTVWLWSEPEGLVIFQSEVGWGDGETDVVYDAELRVLDGLSLAGLGWQREGDAGWESCWLGF